MGDQNNDKISAATKAKFDDYLFGEKHEPEEQDALHRELNGGGGTERVERVASTTGEQEVDWRKELKTATDGLKELKTLEGKEDVESQKRAQILIDGIDVAFQKALPYLKDNATDADAQMFGKGASVQEIQAERKQVLQALGFPPEQPFNGDNLKNAILNAPNESVRNALVHIQTLNEMEQVAVSGVGEAMSARHLPYVAGLKYCDFLEKYRPNGVTVDIKNPENVFSSFDVLRAINSPEMQAGGGREAMKRAGDSQAANAGQVVPVEKNPLAVLQAAIQPGVAPADALAQAKKAAELAEAEGMKPADCKKKVEELKAQLNGADATKQQELQLQIAAWQSLEHAGGLANTIVGRMELQKQPPDFEAAKKALLKAANDPVGANMMLDERGAPMYTTLMMVAMTKGDGTMVQKIEGVGTLMQQANEKAVQAEKEKDDNKKKDLLNEATKLGEQAIQQSQVLRDTFGGKNGEELKNQIAELSKKPENQRTEEEKFTLAFLTQIQGLGDMQANAMASVASWDMAKGDGKAADELLTKLQDEHPEFFNGKDDAFKNQFKEMKNSAASMAEDKEIDDLPWWRPDKYARKAWKWATDNAKWIAFGVACVAAVAVTVATAGAGAPVGLAILAGAGAGLVGGTIVGGGLEFASGRQGGGLTGLAKSAWEVAPYAAAGGAAGAVGTYFFAPAGLAALGGPGATAVLGGTTGWGVVGGGFTTGIAGGAFWNAGKVRDNWEVGKYDNWKEAAVDWGTGTAGWGLTGAMTAPVLVTGGSALAALRAGAGTMGKGAITYELARVGFAGFTAYNSPKVADGMQQLGNGGLAMAGFTPRWMLQQAGMSRSQIDAYKAAQAEQANGGGQKVETQQPQVERVADPTPPSNYKPGSVNLEDYYK